MSQSVEPPILPEDSPDREVNCEVALEAAFAALVTASEAQGWTPQETAATLLKIATEHADRLMHGAYHNGRGHHAVAETEAIKRPTPGWELLGCAAPAKRTIRSAACEDMGRFGLCAL